MVINPSTAESYRPEMAESIERVRSFVRKLSDEIRKLIDKGEETIDEHLRFTQAEMDAGRRKQPLEIEGLNVFNLTEDVPGDVMKYLAMLYTAAGWEHASIGCDRFVSEGQDRDEQVKFPNAITLRARR